MVKFKFLAHLPVDHLAHPVVSSLILLLRKFAAFANYVIEGFDASNYYYYYYYYYKHNACGVMVIIVRNRVQILDMNVCVSHSANTLEKGMNATISTPAVSKW